MPVVATRELQEVGTKPPVSANSRFRPKNEDADALIKTASQHPLGLDYLKNGALDSIAATFGVHAFTIELARERC